MGVKTNCLGCTIEYEAPSEKYAKEEDRLCNPCITEWAEKQRCPDCGGGPISTRREDESFNYRTGDGENDFVVLKCNIPIRHCGACEFEFLDYETEHIHLETTNAYLISIGQKPQQH